MPRKTPDITKGQAYAILAGGVVAGGVLLAAPGVLMLAVGAGVLLGVLRDPYRGDPEKSVVAEAKAFSRAVLAHVRADLARIRNKGNGDGDAVVRLSEQPLAWVQKRLGKAFQRSGVRAASGPDLPSKPAPLPGPGANL